MGIFDTIKDKAGDLAGDAGRAGKIGALQVKLRSLNGNVDEALQQLGAEAFALIDTGQLTAPGLEGSVAKVRDTKKSVADMEAEIAKLRAES